MASPPTRVWFIQLSKRVIIIVTIKADLLGISLAARLQEQQRLMQGGSFETDSPYVDCFGTSGFDSV
jgi:hypothetical protein